MGKKVLFAGNEAIGEGAIIAGCRHYYGYPITPQNELTAYMARRLPEVGGVFVQFESELGAIYAVLGTAAAGKLAMTSSSSPGVSLKQEGISYIQGQELPAVVVNVQRGGPGLGNIAPSQSDYFQATKGGGHGDYRNIVLAPHTVQEAVELTILAFELAWKWRVVSMLLADGVLGQMMEPVEFPPMREPPPTPDWAVTGAKGRDPYIIRSLFLEEGVLEEHNKRLQAKYRRIAQSEVRYEAYELDDAEWVLVACGTCARACRNVVMEQRKAGVRVGMLRPITLWPFCYDKLDELVNRGVKGFLTVEMNAGQMVEDVRLAVGRRKPVWFFGRAGGGIPTPEQITENLRNLIREES